MSDHIDGEVELFGDGLVGEACGDEAEYFFEFGFEVNDKAVGFGWIEAEDAREFVVVGSGVVEFSASLGHLHFLLDFRKGGEIS